MIEVNLIGNPNTGKTTLFNSLTKSDEHVGNWHGVTVEAKSKIIKIKDGKLQEEVRIVDLPGIYSFYALSYEEEVSVKELRTGTPVINICDENNLSRNLYLTLSLIEEGIPTILAINKVSKKKYISVDENKLSKELGIKCLKIDAENPESLVELKREILKLSRKADDANIDKKHLSLEAYINVAKERFAHIDKIIKICAYRHTNEVYGASKIDKLFMNKYAALPIFLLIMATIFYLTFFSLGSWLSEIFSAFLSNISIPIGTGWVSALVNEGIIGGAVNLLCFLPQVVLLFLFLSLIEDSGYLSRIAFCFEDIFQKVGLSGKGIYTLLMGFGCSTTAILTARNMDDKNAKIKTALLTPYMSCSAKLPIYAVLGGAFFGAGNIFYVLGLYILGVVVAMLLSFTLEKTVLKSKDQSFILEFPPYRNSGVKRIGLLLWQNVKSFIFRIGTLIIFMNVIVWFLSNFSFSFIYVKNTDYESALATLGKMFAPLFAPLGFNNWGLVSALLAGVVAKEMVVSSVMMFGGIALLAGPASALSYMVFCLLYSPCIASISVMAKEIGVKWTVIGVIIQLLVAYVVSMFVFFAFGNLEIAIGILLLLTSIFVIAQKVRKKKLCKGCAVCKGC